MNAHVDPVNGDCEEVQARCPWTQIGCPETKVEKLIQFLFFECLIKGGGEGNGGDGMEGMEGGVGLIEAMFNVKHTIY